MSTAFLSSPKTRREMLRTTSKFAGAALLAELMPWQALAEDAAQDSAAGSTDAVVTYRTNVGAPPVVTQKLRDNIHLLSGPGGNIIVLDGPDGRLMVDTFVLTAWAKLKTALNALGGGPAKLVIDTHWHPDHVDNNGSLHDAGATILSHEKTRERLATPRDIPMLGMHLPAAPANVLPQMVFKDSFQLFFNQEEIKLQYFQPAHTDTDIYVHFKTSNVLHVGDTFFNGSYPFIDSSTGGNINGMIAATESALRMTTPDMKIIPGHGPLGDMASLKKYYEVISMVRERVQKQKAAGKSLQDVIAAKPTAEFDASWGQGFIKPDMFVTLVYSTL